MHRCDNADSPGSATGGHGGSVAQYRDESLGSYDATQLRHQEMNAIQEEIAYVIEEEGYSMNADTETPSTGMNQLNLAIEDKLYADRINNNSGVPGSFVDTALDYLENEIVNLGSDDIANDSAVPGSDVSTALDNLEADIDDLEANNQSIVEAAYLTYDESDTDQVLQALQTRLVVPYLRTQRHCLVTSDFATPRKRGVQVTWMEMRDSADNYNIQYLGSVYTKLLLNSAGTGLEAWASGNGSGGAPDAGITLADNLIVYYIALLDPLTGAVDFGFDVSVTAANLLASTAVSDADFTEYRIIGWLRLNDTGSNVYEVLPFRQNDSRIFFGDVGSAFSGGIGSSSFTDVDISNYIPDSITTSGTIVGVDLYLDDANSGDSVRYRQYLGHGDGIIVANVSASQQTLIAHAEMATSSGNVRMRNVVGAPTINIVPKWWDWNNQF